MERLCFNMRKVYHVTMSKPSTVVTALRAIFALQNLGFGIWFFVMDLGVVALLMIFPIAFVLFAQILQWKFWPTTVRGMLTILLPPYVFITYRAIVYSADVGELAGELGVVIAATIFIGLLLSVIHVAGVGIAKRNWSLVWKPLLQVPLFVAPAFTTVWFWLTREIASSIDTSPLLVAIEFTAIITANVWITYKQFLKQSILAQTK